jgi:hypothetical protein
MILRNLTNRSSEGLAKREKHVRRAAAAPHDEASVDKTFDDKFLRTIFGWSAVSVILALTLHTVFVVSWRLSRGCWLYSSWILGRSQEACSDARTIPAELGILGVSALLAVPISAWLRAEMKKESSPAD